MEYAGALCGRKIGIAQHRQQRPPIGAQQTVTIAFKRKRHGGAALCRNTFQHHRPLAFEARCRRPQGPAQPPHRTAVQPTRCARCRCPSPRPAAPARRPPHPAASLFRFPTSALRPSARARALPGRRRSDGTGAGSRRAATPRPAHEGFAAPQFAVIAEPDAVPGKDQPFANIRDARRPARRHAPCDAAPASPASPARVPSACWHSGGAHRRRSARAATPIERVADRRSPARRPRGCAGCRVRRYAARRRCAGSQPSATAPFMCPPTASVGSRKAARDFEFERRHAAPDADGARLPGNHPHDGIVGRPHDGPVVMQEGIGHLGKPVHRFAHCR